ncbi:MAG TPA: hypothetical protein VG738_18695 [Chitinophagaceae bacterium]|nr:hypothetical protein [Chitinophagaceae bacterium]
MADNFNLPIEFNGQEYEYPTQILRYGYTHKIQVDVNNKIVTFEPDEEGNYRALTDQDISPALLKEISDTLKVLLS